MSDELITIEMARKVMKLLEEYHSKLLREIFGKVTKEEKKEPEESELRKIVTDLAYIHPVSELTDEDIDEGVKAIRDLAKKKVDECQRIFTPQDYGDELSTIKWHEAKQRLEGM